MMNIKNIILNMPPPIIPVIPQHYSLYRSYMKDFCKTELQPYDTVGFNKSYRMNIAIAPFTIWVVWANDFVWRFDFYEGFWTDDASIPQILRSLIDNNDPRITIPSWLHDLGHQTRDLDKIFGEGVGFDQINELMKEACLWYGMGKFYANRIFDAISSPIGKNLYYETEELEVVRRGKIIVLSPEQYKQESQA
ncbi:MAG: hypothetical protein GY799_12335 [Desulfobulbaceae bacterium]|nr:hypothetical protein [Desulfobulbaceae bacterium]